MNFDKYDITSNADGTYTLTPKAEASSSANTQELVDEYRRIKETAQTLLAHRNDINDKLQALAARRDEIKAILLADGVDGDTYES